jgi:Arc-like DNA binding domain
MPRNHAPQSRTPERDDPVTRTLRFDEDLRQQLKEAASRSVRSANSEIIFRPRSSLEQEASSSTINNCAPRQMDQMET